MLEGNPSRRVLETGGAEKLAKSIVWNLRMSIQMSCFRILFLRHKEPKWIELQLWLAHEMQTKHKSFHRRMRGAEIVKKGIVRVNISINSGNIKRILNAIGLIKKNLFTNCVSS